MRSMSDHDELSLYKQNKIKAMGFLHPLLNYLPSYRIDLKKKQNNIIYSIERKPAWTDRIFYRVTNKDCRLTLVDDKYTSAYIKGTDHM